MKSDLVGRRVRLMISDPWDFGTECGVGPFYGRLVDVSRERMLVELEHPIIYSNVTYKSAACQVRHEGTSTDDLRGATTVPVNIFLFPGNAKSLSELDKELSNEAFGAIGTIELS